MSEEIHDLAFFVLFCSSIDGEGFILVMHVSE